MKKFMTCATLVIFSLAACQQAQRTPLDSKSTFLNPYSLGYDGIRDETWATGSPHEWRHEFIIRKTTLGILARYSDIIGVGRLEKAETNPGAFIAVVDHALIGCENDERIVIHSDMNWVPDDKKLLDYMPANQSRIVFAVYTNKYSLLSQNMFWDSPEIPFKAKSISDYFIFLRHYDRSWWHLERDDGVLFDHFTNVIQAVRFDRNWTNYFELCRDGAFSTSNRVREDSFWDMRALVMYATREQEKFINKDPRVDSRHKAFLFRDDWGNPEIRRIKGLP